RLWTKINERRTKYKTRSTLYGELGLAHRILRDFVGTEITRVQVDSRLIFESLKEFTSEFVPELESLLELYEGDKPIFDMYDTENEIQRSLERKVDLKSGGYLIIDQTEAMTTVDINTGAFVGRRNLEETIFNTNVEATQA
ncbi:ribonuclease E/G, partial [Vibrio alfacsensis]